MANWQDMAMSWVVCVIPRFVWIWVLNNTEFSFGAWAPHIYGRMLGRDAHRVDDDRGKI